MDDMSLRSIIKSIALDKFCDCDITLKRGSEAGNGFCSDIIGVTVDDKSSRKKLNLFVKLSTGNETMRKSLSINELYKNEINFYRNVYPKLKALQNDIGVEEPFQSIPEFYTSSQESGKEYVILENLKPSNYELLNPKEALDDQHVRFIFSEYARFHALSMAMKEHKPNEYLKIKSNMPDMYARIFKGNEIKVILKGTIEMICENLNSNTEAELKHIMEGYKENGSDYFIDLPNVKEEYSCYLHGDCWSNNLLFKYEHNGERKFLTDMRIIDWQLGRFGSPVLDLSYSLYSGTSDEILSNVSLYTDIYYESLTTSLSELKCDVNEVYPKHIFREHWKKYAKYGMLMGFLLLKIKLTEKTELVDNPLLEGEGGKEWAQTYTNLTCDVDGFMLRVRQALKHLKSIGAL